MSIPLANSPADVTRWALVQLGFGTSPLNAPLQAWPFYATNEPSEPDNCLTAYDTTAQSDGRSMPDGEAWFHYGIQFRIRAQDPATGWAKAKALQVFVNEQFYRVSVPYQGHEYFLYCISKTTLLFLGKDTPASKRSLYTVNGTVTLRQVS